ncbi:MAG: hypothetical protein QW279_15420 [Candidatus Jordarchaeaceae archaeon]
MERVKFYGPVYIKLALKYILEFEAEKLKEEPPQNLQELEDVANYIIANLDRYPNGHCSLHYGTLKADVHLQGGIGLRKITREVMKNILEASGFLKNLIGATENAYDALKILPIREMKQVTRYQYVKVKGKNEVIGAVVDCPYKDSCRALAEEGISRTIGGLHCTLLIFGSVALEIITRKNFDFTLDEFDEPYCKGRIYEI